MTDAPPASLGGAAARGGLVTLAGQVLRIGLYLASILVLARLLEPADFGLVTMVTAIIGIGEVVRDFGLSSAAVQASTLSRGQRSNLFWINTAIGAALALLALAASWPISLLYGEPRLVPVVQVLAVTFLLNGAATQFRAHLNRDLRFVGLAVVDVAASAIALALAVTGALIGWGYWSLVAFQLANSVAGLLIAVVITRWMPGRYDRDAPVRALLGYGGNLLGTQLLTYASRNVDSVVIGVTVGATALGFYDRAFQILMLPLNQINAPATKVALPVLSRLQDERERYADFIVRGQSILVQVICAVFAFAASQAPALFLLVLGPGWEPSAAIFQLLAIAGVAQASSYATYWVFLSQGLTRANLKFSLVSRPFLVVAVLIGSLGGVMGVALAYAIASLLIWPAGVLVIARVSTAPAARMFANGARAIVGYAVCAAGSFLAGLAVSTAPAILVVAAGAAGFLATLVLVCLVWPRFRRDLIDIGRVARLLRRR